MSKFGLIAIAGVAIITLAYLVYVAATFETPEGTTTVVIPPPSLQPVEAEPEPATPRPPTPQPRQIETEPEPATVTSGAPVEAVEVVEVEAEPEPEPEPASTPAVQLPSLNNSDNFVLRGLRELQNGAALVRWASDEQLIRRFVVLVDNVARGELPQTGLPYRAIEEDMAVRTLDDNLFVMDESAHARFNNVIDAFVALDTGAAVAFYRTLSPLFQQAYSEIGFRDVDFDDTLRDAMRAVISAPEIEGPYQLVQPSVLYLYADSSIENRNAVQKQLIRLGPENTARLKDALRSFLAEF